MSDQATLVLKIEGGQEPPNGPATAPQPAMPTAPKLATGSAQGGQSPADASSQTASGVNAQNAAREAEQRQPSQPAPDVSLAIETPSDVADAIRAQGKNLTPEQMEEVTKEVANIRNAGYSGKDFQRGMQGIVERWVTATEQEQQPSVSDIVERDSSAAPSLSHNTAQDSVPQASSALSRTDSQGSSPAVSVHVDAPIVKINLEEAGGGASPSRPGTASAQQAGSPTAPASNAEQVVTLSELRGGQAAPELATAPSWADPSPDGEAPGIQVPTDKRDWFQNDSQAMYAIREKRTLEENERQQAQEEVGAVKAPKGSVERQRAMQAIVEKYGADSKVTGGEPGPNVQPDPIGTQPATPQEAQTADRAKVANEMASEPSSPAESGGTQMPDWIKRLVEGNESGNAHVLVEGESGSGKSLLTKKLAFERMDQGQEVNVVDTHNPESWGGAKNVFQGKDAGAESAIFMRNELESRKTESNRAKLAGEDPKFEQMTMVFSDFARLMKDSPELQKEFRTILTEARKFKMSVIADTTRFTGAESGMKGIENVRNNFGQKVQLFPPGANGEGRTAKIGDEVYQTPQLPDFAERRDIGLIQPERVETSKDVLRRRAEMQLEKEAESAAQKEATEQLRRSTNEDYRAQQEVRESRQKNAEENRQLTEEVRKEKLAVAKMTQGERIEHLSREAMQHEQEKRDVDQARRQIDPEYARDMEEKEQREAETKRRREEAEQRREELSTPQGRVEADMRAKDEQREEDAIRRRLDPEYASQQDEKDRRKADAQQRKADQPARDQASLMAQGGAAIGGRVGKWMGIASQFMSPDFQRGISGLIGGGRPSPQQEQERDADRTHAKAEASDAPWATAAPTEKADKPTEELEAKREEIAGDAAKSHDGRPAPKGVQATPAKEQAQQAQQAAKSMQAAQQATRAAGPGGAGGSVPTAVAAPPGAGASAPWATAAPAAGGAGGGGAAAGAMGGAEAGAAGAMGGMGGAMAALGPAAAVAGPIIAVVAAIKEEIAKSGEDNRAKVAGVDKALFAAGSGDIDRQVESGQEMLLKGFNSLADAAESVSPILGAYTPMLKQLAQDFTMVGKEVIATSRHLGQFNGNLAVAVAERDVRNTMRDMDRSTRFGDQYAELLRQQQGVEDKWGRLADRLTPLFIKMAEAVLQITDWIVGKLDSAMVLVLESLRGILQAVQAIPGLGASLAPRLTRIIELLNQMLQETTPDTVSGEQQTYDALRALRSGVLSAGAAPASVVFGPTPSPVPGF